MGIRRGCIILLLSAGVVAGCDRASTNGSEMRPSGFSSARTVFEKRRVCAEEGRRYFSRKRGELRPTLADHYLNVTGPVFAYNASMDTCLCEYHIHEYAVQSREGWDAGWIDDIFANIPVANYSEETRSDGSSSNNGMMSRTEFARKSAELMNVK